MIPNDFSDGYLRCRTVLPADLASVRDVLDHNSHYHQNIVFRSPEGLAERTLDVEVPQVQGSRVFRRFHLIEAPTLSPRPVALCDTFVGFPNYKTASVALLMVHEGYHRKGIGSHFLTLTLPKFLRETHPAVTWISVSLTDNNVPALRCLLKCRYTRSNQWEKLDARGRPVTAITFKLNIAEALDGG